LVSIDPVWIADAGTPTPRTARTIASTVRFAADKAGADLEAERVTDTDSDARSGVIITDPWPSTLSVSGVDGDASAAGAKLSQIRTTPAAVRACTETPFDRLTTSPKQYARTAAAVTRSPLGGPPRETSSLPRRITSVLAPRSPRTNEERPRETEPAPEKHFAPARSRSIARPTK
jgi:hypothetical protein